MLFLLGCVASMSVSGSSPETLPSPQTIEAPFGNADGYVGFEDETSFSTIQEAINAASEGDWILVGPGTYNESLDYGGKSLWISSSQGPEETNLNGGNSEYTVAAQHGETSQTALVGFTLSGGRTAVVGVDFASIHLEDVVIRGSSAGYIIYGSAADVELQNVSISGNSESSALISMDRGSLQMTDSLLDCGRSSYAIYTGHGSVQIDNSSLDCGTRGYSIFTEHSTGTVIRSTLKSSIYLQNEEDHFEDAIDLRNSLLMGSYTAIYGTGRIINSVIDGGKFSFTAFVEVPGTPLIENSIFLNSSCAIQSDSAFTARNNSFWRTTPDCAGSVLAGVDGNLDVDPLLVDLNGGDYHLQNGSPLIDAGVDEDSYDDLDGSRNDIGAYGGHFSLDGGW